MKLFGDRLPAADAALVREHLGGRPTVLAWAETADGIAVALPDRLLVRRGDGWEELPWDDVLSGGWDDDALALRWRRMSTSQESSVDLIDPKSLPEVFRERVEATILVQQVVHASPGRAITLTARRSLGDAATSIRWTAHPAPGVRMEGETLAYAERALARLRAEYEF
ncbi:MAG: hypothetical protein ACK5LS_05320 [Propioniciclava sp.]